MTETPETLTDALPAVNESRRRALQLGAVGAATMLTIRPALAQTAASVINCQIPVPAPGHYGAWIAPDGILQAPGTAGSFPPATAPFTGQQVKQALAGGTLPGTTPEQSTAYLNYIRMLQPGMSGFTCYASLQMPR